MTLVDEIKADIAAIVKEKGCGPIFIRLRYVRRSHVLYVYVVHVGCLVDDLCLSLTLAL